MQKIWFCACAVLFAATVLAAQTRPDFSGTWALDRNAGAKTTGGGSTAGGTMHASGVARATVGGGGPIEYRISQTGTSLTIERTAGASTHRFVHTFDGSENVNVNNRTTIRSKSRWDGAQLVTEGTETVATSAGEVTSTFREVRSLASDGSLVVETTRTTERGTTTTRRIYRKKE